ncbi:SHOCT domain-containing protein [Streptomyces sp. NPDC046203]|uniref:SHOCT domain-containing protein n=1 Tax=Streptomyces sp. NPDC046203 TaxID=3154602 RepID=UPI00340504DD
MWIFLWVLWFMLLFRIIGDIIRDDDLSGWAKAGWAVLVVLLPFLGCFVYLLVRGKGMGKRELHRAQANEKEFQEYIRAAATPSGPSGGGHADQLSKLAELKAQGHLTDEEYQRAKEKVLAS